MPMSVGNLSGVYGFRWWCPGCDCMHMVPTKPLAPTTDRVGAPNGWEFNGDYDHPTLSPSVLVYSHPTFINGDLEGDALTAAENITESPRCHSFIRDGTIQYLSDSTHQLGGQTVPMMPLPE